jgi:pre-mRNA branch site protein p14
MSTKPRGRLPPEVNRIVYVRNLPFKIPASDLFDLFGKYGPIRQVRLGNDETTRGTAFIVYEDIYDANEACKHLNGFNVGGRYLICLFYQPNKMNKKLDQQKKKQDLEKLKSATGFKDE